MQHWLYQTKVHDDEMKQCEARGLEQSVINDAVQWRVSPCMYLYHGQT